VCDSNKNEVADVRVCDSNKNEIADVRVCDSNKNEVADVHVCLELERVDAVVRDNSMTIKSEFGSVNEEIEDQLLLVTCKRGGVDCTPHSVHVVGSLARPISLYSNLRQRSSVLSTKDPLHTHAKVNHIQPPPSVTKADAVRLALAGCGAITMAYREGGVPESEGPTKATMDALNRAKRKWERENQPNTSPLEAVADFNSTYATEFGIKPDKIGLKGFSCARPFMKTMVLEMKDELENTIISDEDRAHDGYMYTDTTYSPYLAYYMHTAIYNYQLRITIPILVTWLRNLDAISYSSHFDDLFATHKLLRPNAARTSLLLCSKGFVIDFADADVIGVAPAYGKVVLRLRNDVRDDSTLEFLNDGAGHRR
jgi:hypothetical protein